MFLCEGWFGFGRKNIVIILLFRNLFVNLTSNLKNVYSNPIVETLKTCIERYLL